MARNKTTRVTRSAAAARVREHGGNTKDTNAEGIYYGWKNYLTKLNHFLSHRLRQLALRAPRTAQGSLLQGRLLRVRQRERLRGHRDQGFRRQGGRRGGAPGESRSDTDYVLFVTNKYGTQIVKDGGRNTARISPAPESAATAVSRTKQEAKEAKEAKEARRARALKNAKPQSALSKVEQDEAVINRRISNPKLRSMLRSYKPRGPPRNRARTGFNLTDRHGKTMMR